MAEIPQDIAGFVSDEFLQLLQEQPDSLSALAQQLGAVLVPHALPAEHLALVKTILQAAVLHARTVLRELPRVGTQFTPYGTAIAVNPCERHPHGCLLLLVQPATAPQAPTTQAKVVPMTGIAPRPASGAPGVAETKSLM